MTIEPPTTSATDSASTISSSVALALRIASVFDMSVEDLFTLDEAGGA